VEVEYHKKFLKDLSVLPTAAREEIEHFVFELLPSLKNLAESNKFEKMAGYPNCFKARFGNYRIGAYYTNNTLQLKRVLNRKEIYRVFP